MQQSIQVSFLVQFDEDTAEVPEAEVDSVLRDQIKDHAAAIGRHYDGMAIVNGTMNSSVSGAELF